MRCRARGLVGWLVMVSPGSRGPGGGVLLPRREASRGFMSKMSMPCIFPRISRRSRPVACSRSVGTVPGAAPGGRRSASVWISEFPAPLLAIGAFHCLVRLLLPALAWLAYLRTASYEHRPLLVWARCSGG